MLAKSAAGYSGADIESICREAAMNALRRDTESKEVTLIDFKDAMARIKPSITQDMNMWYQGFTKRVSGERAAIPVT
jgi:transitional endoplasmic reticulum ATPase